MRWWCDSSLIGIAGAVVKVEVCAAVKSTKRKRAAQPATPRKAWDGLFIMERGTRPDNYRGANLTTGPKGLTAAGLSELHLVAAEVIVVQSFEPFAELFV